MYMLKNIVRNGTKGSQVVPISQATFIDFLNDDYAQARLLSLMQ